MLACIGAYNAVLGSERDDSGESDCSGAYVESSRKVVTGRVPPVASA